jgi:uncharacterized protein YpbB
MHSRSDPTFDRGKTFIDGGIHQVLAESRGDSSHPGLFGLLRAKMSEQTLMRRIANEVKK